MNSRIFASVLRLSLALAPFAPAAHAQNLAPDAPGRGDLDARVRPTNILNVGADNLANVSALLGRAGAVSLGATAADLDQNPAARDALLDYVGQGGTLFLHTDAARLFGYRTVAARETTAQQVGQLYGRARAAVPFGTVPLLWGGGANTARGAARAPGINQVFYTLRAGDDLVVDHPAGTPLLQVSGAANPPLYAAAIAPYGAGFAVFTPNFIDQSRGDGAAFARNLLKLVGGSRYVGVPQAAIASGDGLLEALARAVQNGDAQSAALPGLGSDLPLARPAVNGANNAAPIASNNQNAPGAANEPGAANQAQVMDQAASAPPDLGPVLLLTRGEARAFGGALQNDPQGRGAVALAILRARVALLNGDARSAEVQLTLADKLAPNTGEVQFLRGAAAVAGAGLVGSNSIDRATSANLAANAFAAAGRTRPFFNFATITNSVGGNVAGNAGGTGIEGADVTRAGTLFFDDIAGAQFNSVGAQLNRFAQVLALEPPLSRTVGNDASAVTIRYFGGDTALPFIERAVADLTRSPLFSGSIDGQEILLFPTPALYQNYRARAGLDRQNVPLPAAALGDVVDGRILMVSIPATRAVSVGPNGVPRILPLRATSANVLSRFEAYALLESYVGEGNARTPSWMTLGLSTLADLAVNGDTVSVGFDQELRRYATINQLLAPRQFDGQLGQTSQLALAQSTAIMRYFYAQFGAGRVAETVQRIGAGQSVDDALIATTGLDELGLFRAWRSAQFVGLNLPN